MSEHFQYINNATEVRIAKSIVHRLLNSGYQLRVNDGEETVTPITKDLNTIFAAMASTEMDYLLAYKDGKRVGSVMLIWGNGEDLLSDCSVSLDEIMQGVAG